MTYSIDFRRQVLLVRERDNLTIAEVATRFGVGVASVVRWLKKLEPQPGRNKPATRIDRIALARDVRMYPDAYQAERARRLGVSEKGIGHALRRMNSHYKKTRRHPRADAGTRRFFLEKIKAYKAAGRVIVYLDERGFAHAMPRTHGYALAGQRCYGLCDWNARGRINVIGALIGQRRVAVGLFPSTINTDVFYAWPRQVLLPQ